MDCSTDVIGPDSFGSVEIVPVIDASTSAGTHTVTPKTAPDAPIKRSRPA
jgi:hypothetical protein